MSGRKGRSGRKPDLVVNQLRAQMDEAISASDWRAVWRAVIRAAKKGNIPAVKLVVEYRFGLAAPQLEQSAILDGVVYYLPVRPDQPLPASLGPDPHAVPDLSLDPSPGPAASVSA